MQKKRTMTKEGSAHNEELPYRIVLWAVGAEGERVLARAVTAQLALAIFKAAQQEHPDRRIAVKKKNAIIADSQQT
jgi:hypothetical protein